MKYVKLFEQFVNEAIDLHNAYPYTYAGGSFADEADGGGADGLSFNFTTEGRTDYDVILEMRNFNYDFTFNPQRGGHNTMTEEHDALRVLATVSKILIDIIENYAIDAIPIVVKGSRVIGKEELGTENKRDRIYKNIAQRVTRHIKPKDPNVLGYEFVDLQRFGFQLNPIYE